MASINTMNALRLARGQWLQPKSIVMPARCLSLYAARSQTVSSQEKKPLSTAPKAQFHASARRNLLPPLPERIHGGPNEPVPIIPPNPVHGSYHWAFERLVSVGLIPLTIAPFAAGSLNPLMDSILCGLILLHSHIGFQSVIIDYLPQWRVPLIRKAFWWALRLATVSVGIGLYEYETNDIGVTETIKKAWLA